MALRAGSSRHLNQAALAPATRSKYRAAVQTFLSWCDQHGESSHTSSELDALLCDFIHDLYETGGSKATATCALFGLLVYFPHHRDRMFLSRAALRGWSKLHPPQPYPPLTWEV